jgi:lipopolysaccharide biosynthesis regulator YciM
MACRGVYFAIAQCDAERLLSARSDTELLEIVKEDIEEKWDKEWLLEIDKAWDAIDRCLREDTACARAFAVLAGLQLHEGDDYIVSLKTPSQVAAIARELAKLNDEWLRSRYEMIPLDDSVLWKSEEDLAYTTEYFHGLEPFFRKAAMAARHVIFTVDQ